MLKNYLKTALRSLLKNKAFSVINITGLALGTLCCLYMVLYVMDQYSYDRHHAGANNIYRITSRLFVGGDSHQNATMSPPVAPAMKADFGEVLQYTRVVPTLGVSKHILEFGDKSFYEKKAVYVDSTFFDMFSYHFTRRVPGALLNEPYTVVLQKSVSDKLFGADDPINKTITINNAYGRHDFKVTGVVDEAQGKTHIMANIFITMNSGDMGEYTLKDETWGGNNFANAYVKLRPDADVAALEKKLPAFLEKYGGQQMKQMGMTKVLHLQPVGSIHTTPGYENEMNPSVSPMFLNILLTIAGLIQLIACINFMNLSTARASRRAKEVGVRKVIGAARYELIRQFLAESFLLSLIGVLLALPLLTLLLPWLNQLTGSSIQLSFYSDYRLWLVLAGLVLVTGFAAGSYPAFYLSSFQAVKVIKGNFTSHISASGIRRSLVVFQFVLSIVMITGIIGIYSQLNYIKKKDLGFSRDQKLIFSFYTDDAKKKGGVFAKDLQQMAEVQTLSRANNYPSHRVLSDHTVFLAGGNMATGIDAQNISTDEHYAQANGMKLVSGEDFRQGDSDKVLINETLCRKLGLTAEKAPGIRLYSQFPGKPLTFVTVNGVLHDFNFNSLHADIKPFIVNYYPQPDDLPYLIVSLSSSNYERLIAHMASLWRKDLPATPFEYAFLDEEVEKQYEAEITLSRIINSFTLMAIFISCLGLFGLASFSAEQRSKEIGIRKVLGASIAGIVQLLSKDFLKLVGLAIVIAVPISWWAINKWLEAFAYRMPVGWWMFALAGVVAVAIAMLSVASQAVRAAVANPVNSLRSE